MGVIFLDIYTPSDIDGTPLTVLSDEDCESLEFRAALSDLGALHFVLNKDLAAVSSPNLAWGNIIKVRIPVIQAAPVWGAVLGSSHDVVASEDEEGGEQLQRGASGLLSLLRNAVVPPAPQFDGAGYAAVAVEDGRWKWTDVHPIAIFRRLLAEDAHLPVPALDFVSQDFSDTLDSDGAAIPAFSGDIELDAGMDLWEVYGQLRAAEEFDLYMRPTTFKLRAFVHQGTDRSSLTFAAGKVRFEKGVNILTEMAHDQEGWIRASHAWVEGRDGVAVLAERDSWAPGDPVRYIFTEYGHSKSAAVLQQVGQRRLKRRELRQDSAEFEIAPGDDQLAGLYLPFKHFSPGDDVTAHSGNDAAAHDFVNAKKRVTGIRVVVDEASDDADDDSSRRSLHIVPELDNETIREADGFPTTPAAAKEAVGDAIGDVVDSGILIADCHPQVITDYLLYSWETSGVDDGGGGPPWDMTTAGSNWGPGPWNELPGASSYGDANAVSKGSGGGSSPAIPIAAEQWYFVSGLIGYSTAFGMSGFTVGVSFYADNAGIPGTLLASGEIAPRPPDAVWTAFDASVEAPPGAAWLTVDFSVGPGCFDRIRVALLAPQTGECYQEDESD